MGGAALKCCATQKQHVALVTSLFETERRPIELSTRPIPTQPEGQIKIRQEILHHIPHALFAGDGEAPDVEAAQQHCFRAEGDGLQGI